MKPARIIEDIACTRCGCVCDDLKATVQDRRIESVEGACSLCEDWFLQQNSTSPPAARVGADACSIATAVDRAAEILQTARNPLVYGLSRSSTEGQRAAVRLADELRANIDTTASLCHAPSIMAIQEVGESTCSLGEIRNRADLVVFWGVNPCKTHPRHLERYSGNVAGMFTPNGRVDRTIVVIDTKCTETAAAADVFVQVPEGRDFELAWILRALLAGIEPPDDYKWPVDPTAVRALLDRFRNCRCGVFFFGLGVARGNTGHRNVEAILRLTAELNAHTRFHARRMRIYGDVTGADSVLCWQTGFPFAVSLTRGYPRYSPGEYSAEALLERGEADACLLVGAESVSEFNDNARRYLERIQTIVLDYPDAEVNLQPTVHFTTAVYGVHLPGTDYRMDEIPIPLRGFLPTQYASDAEILRLIRESVTSD